MSADHEALIVGGGAHTSPEVTLAAATPGASPSPRLDRAKRSGGTVIVYVIVLLAFGGLYLFTRDRLRRT